MRSGRPPTLWWLLISADCPTMATDSMTSGYRVPWARKSTVPELACFRFEDVDERRADDLALLLRIGDPVQPLQKQIRRVDEPEGQVQPLEPFPDLRGFVQPQHAVVDENARELVADRPMDDQGCDRRVDAAAQGADDLSVADLRANPRRRLFHERGHRPVAGAAADSIRKVAEDLEAVIGVHDFRMEQQRVQTAIGVCHRRHRGVGARRHDRKAGRRGGDEVSVARPDANLSRHVGKQRHGLLELDRRMAELALRRRGHRTAKRIRHQLHAVANAQHRRPNPEDRRIALRRARVRHALGTARQDDADRIPSTAADRRACPAARSPSTPTALADVER